MIFRVNLATGPLQTHRWFWAFSVSGGTVLILLFLAFGWHVYSVRRSESAFRTEHNRLSDELGQLTLQKEELSKFFSLPENAKLHDRAAFINSIIDERSFNWTMMFMDLEEILPVGVHVISIEPKQVNGQVVLKLTIGVVNNDAKLKFLHALEQSASFTDMRLTSVRAPSQDFHEDEELLDLVVTYSKA